jgi:hypothetical protein
MNNREREKERAQILSKYEGSVKSKGKKVMYSSVEVEAAGDGTGGSGFSAGGVQSFPAASAAIFCL